MNIYQLFITLSQLIPLQEICTTCLAPGHLQPASPASAAGALSKVTAGDLNRLEKHQPVTLGTEPETLSGSAQHRAWRSQWEQKRVGFT